MTEKRSPTLDEFRAFLKIDDLDACLVEQAEVYHHVSEQYILAVSRRDADKLNHEELLAQLDRDIRSKAADAGEKLTEGAIESRLTILPKVKESARKCLDSKTETDRWGALKESFQQRSHALRELVALRLGERRDLALEGGAGQARAALAENIRTRAGEMRQARKKAS